MSWKEWDSVWMKINNENLIPIRLNWTDVKENRIEFEYTEVLCIAWIYIMDDEDYILQMYEIDFPLNY
jgi:hypothetical protein